MSKTFLIIIIFICGVVFSDPFEPLDINFLKKNKQQYANPVTAPTPSVKKKGNLPSYDAVIKDLQIIQGLFELYWNQEENRFIMSIHQVLC